MNNQLTGNFISPKKSNNLVIKIFNILLFVAIASLLPMSAANSNKNQLVTMNMNNKSVQAVLNEIEKQTSYLFIINSTVDTNRKVNISVQKKHVKEVLVKLFAGTKVNFAFQEKHIILSANTNMVGASYGGGVDDMTSKSGIVGKKISGTVIDEEGNPLIGVSIRVKGASTGVATDLDGRFFLDGDFNDNTILEASYIGMKPMSVKLGKRNILNIVMTSTTEKLDEVVVVGYGTQKKINLTGAVSTVDVAKQLESRPITDVARGLQGSASGLTVRTSTGELGTNPSMKIRGVIGSINGSSSPLILVDNVECNSLQNINPDDVESVSVLKDAASASIYGVKAAFGVVLITTKKAKKGDKVTISYTNNFSWKSPTVTPEIVKTYEGAEMSWQAGLRSNPNLSEQTNSCYLSWNLESIERMKEWDRVYGGMNLRPEMVMGRDFDIIDGKMYFYRSFDAQGNL